ncbi:colicin immunity domain-containing protein [Stenotrophomonas sp. PS02289]|uniref:colicin immunity domain-containing protein n=1 Tax=Stenotrophomonas sp. PS02289 TaxID=2991422 RepID=UPI00249B05E8|nr:colicin immunity domain-containing protein [Stenotrophomonas sp. PS02289]
MSVTMLRFAKSFTEDRITAEVFSSAYLELRRIEGAAGLLASDPPNVDECISEIFYLVDIHVLGDGPVDPGELDDDALRVEVRRVLGEFGFQ